MLNNHMWLPYWAAELKKFLLWGAVCVHNTFISPWCLQASLVEQNHLAAAWTDDWIELSNYSDNPDLKGSWVKGDKVMERKGQNQKWSSNQPVNFIVLPFLLKLSKAHYSYSHSYYHLPISALRQTAKYGWEEADAWMTVCSQALMNDSGDLVLPSAPSCFPVHSRVS